MQVDYWFEIFFLAFFFFLFTLVTAVTVIVTFPIRTSFEQILLVFYSVLLSFAFSFKFFYDCVFTTHCQSVLFNFYILRIFQFSFCYWWMIQLWLEKLFHTFSIFLNSLRLVLLLTLCHENVLHALEKNVSLSEVLHQIGF